MNGLQEMMSNLWFAQNAKAHIGTDQDKLKNEVNSMAETVIIKCPFCKEGDISISKVPDVYTTQTIRVGSNRKTIPKLVKGKETVLVEECPSCHKTKKEIEKCFKVGKPQSKEDIIKRAQESGLPLRF